MTMNQAESYLERPNLYNNIDGMGELVMGFYVLGSALFAWFNLHSPTNSVWHKIYMFAIYMAVMLAIMHYGNQAIKERITYRRTGFVAYRPRDKYWIPFVLGAGVSALLSAIVYLIVRRHWDISTATPVFVMGLMFAAMYVRLARTVRWKWAMFYIVVATVLAIAALPADLPEAFANHTGWTLAIPAKVVGAYWLTFVVCGAEMMISGSVSFWLYLRHTQAPAQEGQ
jgi:hypothetical protein